MEFNEKLKAKDRDYLNLDGQTDEEKTFILLKSIHFLEGITSSVLLVLTKKFGKEHGQ